jgi:excisionase family DNA binding protein
MTARREERKAPALLTVEAAAERLDTKPRFVRRLIAERRIEFVKIGRYVRISESALCDFIDSGRVEPMTVAGIQHRMRGVA